MASTSETGHDIDIANAKKAIKIMIALGAEYQPPVPELEPDPVKTQVKAAEDAQKAVNEAKKDWSKASDDQENAFANLGTLSTSVNKTVSILRIPQNRKDEVNAIHRKLQGRRSKKIETAEEGKEAPKTASVSQMSFTSRAKNLRDLIGTLKQIPEYLPKEDTLKIPALETLALALETAAELVDPLETTLANARAARNKLYYMPTTGLIDTMKDIKKYLSNLGKRGKHPAYVEMNQLQFTKPPKDLKF